jgi:GTP cyclohydrolase I
VSGAVHFLTDELTLSAHLQLELADRSHGVYLAGAELAVADLLAALGQDPSAERLVDTPRLVAPSYAELLGHLTTTTEGFRCPAVRRS